MGRRIGEPTSPSPTQRACSNSVVAISARGPEKRQLVCGSLSITVEDAFDQIERPRPIGMPGLEEKGAPGDTLAPKAVAGLPFLYEIEADSLEE